MPAMRQEFGDQMVFVCWQTLQYIYQIGIEILNPHDLGHDLWAVKTSLGAISVSLAPHGVHDHLHEHLLLNSASINMCDPDAYFGRAFNVWS